MHKLPKKTHLKHVNLTSLLIKKSFIYITSEINKLCCNLQPKGMLKINQLHLKFELCVMNTGIAEAHLMKAIKPSLICIANYTNFGISTIRVW